MKASPPLLWACHLPTQRSYCFLDATWKMRKDCYSKWWLSLKPCGLRHKHEIVPTLEHEMLGYPVSVCQNHVHSLPAQESTIISFVIWCFCFYSSYWACTWLHVNLFVLHMLSLSTQPDSRTMLFFLCGSYRKKFVFETRILTWLIFWNLPH